MEGSISVSAGTEVGTGLEPAAGGGARACGRALRGDPGGKLGQVGTSATVRFGSAGRSLRSEATFAARTGLDATTTLMPTIKPRLRLGSQPGHGGIGHDERSVSSRRPSLEMTVARAGTLAPKRAALASSGLQGGHGLALAGLDLLEMTIDRRDV